MHAISQTQQSTAHIGWQIKCLRQSAINNIRQTSIRQNSTYVVRCDFFLAVLPRKRDGPPVVCNTLPPPPLLPHMHHCTHTHVQFPTTTSSSSCVTELREKSLHTNISTFLRRNTARATNSHYSTIHTCIGRVPRVCVGCYAMHKRARARPCNQNK